MQTHTVHLPFPFTHIHKHSHTHTPWCSPLWSYILFALSGCAGWPALNALKLLRYVCTCLHSYVFAVEAQMCIHDHLKVLYRIFCMYGWHVLILASIFESEFQKVCLPVINNRESWKWKQSNWQSHLWWFGLLNTENQLGGSGAWGAQKRIQCHCSVISTFNQHSRMANALFISHARA